jgi:hypothetical protein
MIDVVYVPVILKRFIIAKFIEYPEPDNYRYGHAQGQPADGNEGMTLIA